MYHQRLQTFQGVSGLPLNASKFAIAGFSYVGPRDRVKVFFLFFPVEMDYFYDLGGFIREKGKISVSMKREKLVLRCAFNV